MDIALAPDDGICGLDLDVCLNADGALQNWARGIVTQFAGTYQAYSVSGCGLHILCRAELPGAGRNWFVPNGPRSAVGKRAQIGLFDRSRFLALTGRLYGAPSFRLADCQSAVERILGSMQGPNPNAPPAPLAIAPILSDLEIIRMALEAKNGWKFRQLWAGEWQISYSSQSESDLALCRILAFWCGPDPSRIDALFRRSGLNRAKWAERQDYRRRTIQVALLGMTAFYNPKRPRV